jgi:hypothetical protein
MSARRTRSSADSLPATPEGKPKRSARALASIIERSSRIQGPLATAYVDRLRRADPDAGPATIVAKLEKRFVAAVTASGAAVGSTAVLPGLGTLAALSAAAGETAVFLVLTEDRERRRALVLAVLVGDDSKQAMSELIGGGRTSGAWLSEGVASLPLPALSQLNSRLLKRAVRRFTLRRSALLFGKILPVGIGAVIGAVGNRLAGKKIVRNARHAFGTPPARWPVNLHLLPTVSDAG